MNESAICLGVPALLLTILGAIYVALPRREAVVAYFPLFGFVCFDAFISSTIRRAEIAPGNHVGDWMNGFAFVLVLVPLVRFALHRSSREWLRTELKWVYQLYLVAAIPCVVAYLTMRPWAW